MRIRAALLLISLCPGCSWLHALSHSPQAAVDYFDWARERNERGIYSRTVSEVESMGEPYCDLLLGEKDFPLTFALLGLEQSRYIIDRNIVLYPLGDHEEMSHEMAHAILYRGGASEKCLHQIAANAVSRRASE